MKGPLVSVPGKVFLIGEYAVLEGAPAVLSAVSARAYARYVSGHEPASPVVVESLRQARTALGDGVRALPPGSPDIGSGQFQYCGLKLGLGSSAAVAVATVAATFEMGGLPVADNLDLLFAAADAGHRAFQRGMGSGADVATSVYGGFVRFERRPGDAKPAIVKLSPPPSLHVVIFSVGMPAATFDMMSAVMGTGPAAEKPQPDRAAREIVLRDMGPVAGQFARDFAAHNMKGVLAATSAYLELLVALGTASGAGIVTPPFTSLAKLAATLGGAAKPSGAGGGDVGIALFDDPGAATTFASRCPRGISVLDIRADPRGAFTGSAHG